MNFEVLPIHTAAGERYLVQFDNGEALPDPYDTEKEAVHAACRKLGRKPWDYFNSRDPVSPRVRRLVYKQGSNTK